MGNKNSKPPAGSPVNVTVERLSRELDALKETVKEMKVALCVAGVFAAALAFHSTWVLKEVLGERRRIPSQDSTQHVASVSARPATNAPAANDDDVNAASP